MHPLAMSQADSAESWKKNKAPTKQIKVQICVFPVSTVDGF